MTDSETDKYVHLEMQSGIYNIHLWPELHELEEMKLEVSILLLVHNCIEVLNENRNSIKYHPKDIQPEVLHIYIS